MSPRHQLIATACLGVAATATTVTLVVPSAAAGKSTQKLHVNARPKLGVTLDAKHSVSALVLRKRHLGKVGEKVGIMTFTCEAAAKDAATVVCETATSIEGGVLIGPAVVDYAAGTVKGAVKGGGGSFRGATGIIKGTIVRSNHAIITIKYTH